MKHIFTSAIVLGLFGVAGTLLVSSIEAITADRIIANEQAARMRKIAEVMPSELYNNDILNDSVTLPAGTLSERYPTRIYRAKMGSGMVGAVFEATTPEGYAGPIRVLIGIKLDGTVAGVRVLSHTETPGLGDLIELRRSHWVLGFNGKSLNNPPIEQWAVKRDHGDFDQFTGATITPRAVVKTVKQCLLYFQEHKDTLFPPSTTQSANDV